MSLLSQAQRCIRLPTKSFARSKIFLAPRASSCSKRPFFASSTDHTRLLQEAEVHCLTNDDSANNTKKQYVLVASGTEPDLVRKVPKLHLARLCVQTSVSSNNQHQQTTLFDAKVVNRTLGTHVDVCCKLVDAALRDAAAATTTTAPRALSTVHGLSQWALDGINNMTAQTSTKESSNAVVDVLKSLSEEELKAVQAIANGETTNGNDNDVLYNQGQQAWEKLVAEFVAQGLASEAALYQSKGAAFVGVEHRADTSDYADTSGAALAVLSFVQKQ